MRPPALSVVMSVYNGAATLGDTLDSVLNQSDCDLEFIVVNDGSTDDSGAILQSRACRESRLRVIHQENAGLTLALVNGCAAATGEFIARQDAGDISLPGRFAIQSTYLREHPGTTLVACAVQFVGPGREELYATRSSGLEVERGLANLDIRSIKGPPHHGGTMFRRADYVNAGGYRLTFAVAQDIDLWLRLAELGHCFGLDAILYQARLEIGSISARRRSEQFQFARLAIECAKRRRLGLSDRELICSVVPRHASATNRATNHDRARFYYHVASCLRTSNPALAQNYYAQALREQPLFLRALLRRVLG